MKQLITYLLIVTCLGSAFSQAPVLLKDIYPGSFDSTPYGLTCFNNTLYFSAIGPNTDKGIWKSNGNVNNAQEFIVTGQGNILYTNAPGLYLVFNNKILYVLGNNTGSLDFYTTDGVSNTPQVVFDNNNIPWKGNEEVGGLTIYNGKIYFYATDKNNVAGQEVWVTDLTVGGSYMLKDIRTSGASFPRNFKVFNGKLYFSATDDTHGEELWVTDGTAAGTVMLKDINSGDESSYPSDFAEMNGKLYFGAASTANNGSTPFELWETDGTQQGTKLIKSIGYLSPLGMAAYNGLLYFKGNDNVTGNQLWTSDGTADGTGLFKVLKPNGNSSPCNFVEYNGRLYFFASGDASISAGPQLFYTEGPWGVTAPVYLADQTTPKPFENTAFQKVCPCAEHLFFEASYYVSVGKEVYRLTTPDVFLSDNEQVSTNATMVMYPNPATNIVTIKTNVLGNDKATLRVLDITGKQVFAGTITDNYYQLNTTGYNAGIYIVQLHSQGKVATQKLVISQ